MAFTVEDSCCPGELWSGVSKAERDGGHSAVFDRIEAHLDSIERVVLGFHFKRRAPGYLCPLARRLRVIESEQWADMLDDAADDGLLTEAERASVIHADVVLTGCHRDTGRAIYLLVGLAVSIGRDDVERAVERAALLEKLWRPVLPIVGGDRISDEAADLARERGVWSVVDGDLVAPRDG
jgi:hypothetical protein